jgi:uncharacterized protein (TIGR03435 family)
VEVLVRRITLAAVVVVLAVPGVPAQQPTPAFDVASVRPQREPIRAENVATGMIPRALPGGRFSVTHVTVESLLAFAYDLRPYRIVGGPDWIRTDLFAVDAKAADDASAAEVKLMLRSLLDERFTLATRTEAREMRVHALVRVRPDGPLGPTLFRMDAECSPAVVNDLRRTRPDKYVSPIGNGMMSGCSTPGVNYLADFLTLMLGTPVVDATGLEGPFYYSLRAHLPPPSSRLGAAIIDANLPALSTALDEQLGLKLESRRGPVDVLVIESVQPPTEN